MEVKLLTLPPVGDNLSVLSTCSLTELASSEGRTGISFCEVSFSDELPLLPKKVLFILLY
jgi:hypothetical protein